MSLPRRGTTFGEIEINGETYKIFNCPLSDEIVEKLYKYKTNGAGINTSAPWFTDAYKWSIVNNKLYLNEMNILSFDRELYEKSMAEGGEFYVAKSKILKIDSCSKKNIIQELFNTDKLFAEWQNKDIKLLLKEEILHCEIKGRKDYIKMNSRVLKFKDGVLVSTHDEIEEFAKISFKNYIEE